MHDEPRLKIDRDRADSQTMTPPPSEHAP